MTVMSECRRPTHLTRRDVLTYYLDRAKHETRFTLEDFAAALTFEYHDQVPAHARGLDLDVPDIQGPLQAYAHAIGRIVKRVQRYADGSTHLPCELEEAWAAALPEPYRSECRAELARRYGFLAARTREADACSDGEAVSRIMTETGDCIQSLSRALADGRIDAQDLVENPDLLAQLLDAEAALASVRARVEDVRDWKASNDAG